MRLAEFSESLAGLPEHRDGLAVLVETQDLTSEAAGEVEIAIRRHEEATRQARKLPLADVFPVEIEELDAPVVTVGDDHLTVADENRVRLIELPWPCAVAAPRRDELAGTVDAQHAS